MGVVPQQSPLKLLKVWKPIADHLSSQIGEKVTFKTEKSINKFEEILYNGGYDFAYMNPYHYIVANKRQGYVAEVRATKNIKGILVMKRKGDLKRLQEKDVRYLFPSPNAFAATLLTKHELVQKFNVDLDTLDKALYVNSHDSVYKGVSRGVGDIGGGIERTFKNLSDTRIKENLKIIHTTKEYPSHPFAFKPSMDKEVKQRIINALLSMPDELLKALSIQHLIKINDADYNSVKELIIKLKIMPKQ